MQAPRLRNGVRPRGPQGLAPQQTPDLRDGLVRLADDVVRATREQVEGGHADEPDLTLAENEAAQVRLDLEQTRERHLNTWREFAAYLGLPDLPPAPIDGTLEGEAAPFEWRPTLDRLLRESP